MRAGARRTGALDGRTPVFGGIALRIMTGLAVASAATLLITVIWAADPDPAPPDPPDDLVRVGVVEGQSVPGYLDSSRGELDTLLGAPAGTQTWALVTLSAYFAPDKLSPLLGGAAVAEVFARAPLPGTKTQVVRIPAYRLPDDVVAGLLAAAVRRDREQADYRKLSRALDGAGANTIRLRRAYESAASTAAAEAHAYRAHCACVFAAVVRADPAVLHRIADHAEVRAVDPAPEVLALDRAEFRPPLPEQRTTVPEETRSATAPAPPGAPVVAPATLTPLPSSTGAHVTSASPEDPAAGSGLSVPASEERTAEPSAPPRTPVPDVPIPGTGASPGASGR